MKCGAFPFKFFLSKHPHLCVPFCLPVLPASHPTHLGPSLGSLHHSWKPTSNVLSLVELSWEDPHTIVLCLNVSTTWLGSPELGVVSLVIQCLPRNINPITGVFCLNFFWVIYGKNSAPSQGICSSVVSSLSLWLHIIPSFLAQGAPDPLAFCFLVDHTLPTAGASYTQPPPWSW